MCDMLRNCGEFMSLIISGPIDQGYGFIRGIFYGPVTPRALGGEGVEVF